MPHTLSPAMRGYIESAQRFTPASDHIHDRRAAFLRACRACTPQAPAGWQIDDIDLDGLPLRRYKPATATPEGGWPTLLYLHGGGWDLGGLDTHDWFAYAVASRLPIAIVAVDYRLAPEHAYPAPLEDCLKAWYGLRAGRIEPGLSRERLVVGGDSAGGTLAAGLCMALRRDGHAQPLGQLLVYPVLTCRDHLPSMSEHAQAPMMTVAGLNRSLSGFLPGPEQRDDPCAMPLEAQDFSGLAPAFICVAAVDPLRDHGVAYAEALSATGGTGRVRVVDGLVHSGMRAFGVAQVEEVWDELAQAAGQLLRVQE